MNLPKHRKKVLQLRWWREDTRYADYILSSELTLSLDARGVLDYDPTHRLDDNNLEIPCK
jgi:hypothetical protein